MCHAPLVLLAIAAPARAAGDPASPRLSWVRGEGADTCADREAAEKEITKRLGRNLFTADAERSIEVIVHKDGDQWRSRIFVRTRSGELEGQRNLKSGAAGCDAITEATVLAVALAIDPDALLAPLRPASVVMPVAAPARAESLVSPATPRPGVDRQ
jgi:hypothetical protein